MLCLCRFCILSLIEKLELSREPFKVIVVVDVKNISNDAEKSSLIQTALIEQFDNRTNRTLSNLVELQKFD